MYSGTSGSLFKHKMQYLTVIQKREKESIIRARIGKKNPSLVITVWHRWASLVMPNGDPQDRFFYPTLTLVIDFYFLAHQIVMSVV